MTNATNQIDNDADIQPSRTIARAKKAIAGYVPPTGMPFTTDKIVHFLLAMAAKAPKLPFAYNFVYQAINGITRTPASDNKNVLSLARSMSSVRVKLLEKHSCDLVTVRGVGVRASVDGEDRVLIHDKYKAKLGSLYDKTTHHASTVDPTTIANPRMRAGFAESRRTLVGLSDSMGKLRSEKLMKFLPGKSEDTKK